MTLSPVVAHLFTLAVSIAQYLGYPDPPKDVLAYAAEAVARDSNPLFGGQEEELAIGIVWAKHESDFRATAVGDHGKSYGLLQQTTQMSIPQQWNNWLYTLHYAKEKCGTDDRALSMISSGRCTGARRLVENRKREAFLMLELARQEP